MTKLYLTTTSITQKLFPQSIKATSTTDKSDEESSLINSEFGCAKDPDQTNKQTDPIIALLSEFCHSKVLNIDYLLGHSSQPFTNAAAIKVFICFYLSYNQSQCESQNIRCRSCLIQVK